MIVKDALALMAKNPTVDFPWEGALIALVNTFVPEGSQLDPTSADATALLDAINSMEDALKEMVYSSNIGLAKVATSASTLTTPAKSGRTYFLGVFAALCCVIALWLTAKVGNGASSGDVVEILKLLLSLAAPSGPASP